MKIKINKTIYTVTEAIDLVAEGRFPMLLKQGIIKEFWLEGPRGAQKILRVYNSGHGDVMNMGGMNPRIKFVESQYIQVID